MKPHFLYSVFLVLFFTQATLASPTVVSDVNPSELNKLKTAVESVFGLSCPAVDQASSPASIDLQSCLPDRVRNILGASSSVGGPNCYNFSLLATGVFQNLRAINSNELEGLYFNETSQFCEDVSAQAATAGDIVSLEQGSRKIHAYVYLTDKYVLTKNGPDTESKWEISTLDDVMTVYPVSSDVKVEKRYQCASPKPSLDKEIAPVLTAISNFSAILSQFQTKRSLVPSDYEALGMQVQSLAASVQGDGVSALVARANESVRIQQALYELVTQYYAVKSAFYLIFDVDDMEMVAESFRQNAVGAYLPVLNQITEISPSNLFGIDEVYSNEDWVDQSYCEDNDYNPNICSLNF